MQLAQQVLVALVGVSIGALCGHARADVLVVGPGLPFPQIQSAVTAAADGDVVLVKSGAYPGFWMANKGVAVVAELGATVAVEGGIRISGVPAGSTAVLDRLFGVAVQPDALTSYGLHVTNCAGAVRVQLCDLKGADGTSTVTAYPDCDVTGNADAFDAVRVEGSPDVSFSSCTLTGGSGSSLWDSSCHRFQDTWMPGGAGGHGLALFGSLVSVYDSFLTGGPSGFGNYSDQAGHGAWVKNDSTAVLVRVTATGAFGGESLDGIAPGEGGPGGSGMLVVSGCDAYYLQSTFEPGAQGAGWADPGGQFAAPIGGIGATAWSGGAKSIGFLKVLREGQSTQLGVSGLAGETALVFASQTADSFLLPKAKGTLVLDPGSLIGPFVLGVLSGGLLNVNVTMPELPAGIEAVGLHLQALLTGPASATLSSWGHLTLLDSSY